MRLVPWLIIYGLTLALQAIAFEVVIMEYDNIESDEIISYEYKDDGCSCVCEGY